MSPPINSLYRVVATMWYKSSILQRVQFQDKWQNCLMWDIPLAESTSNPCFLPFTAGMVRQDDLERDNCRDKPTEMSPELTSEGSASPEAFYK